MRFRSENHGEENEIVYVCILIHLPLSTAIDLIAIRVLLKWIIVCHHKISTRFKSRTAHWWSIDSFLPSLRSFPFVPRVRFFLFFFSFPKFLIKSVGDISGKNFLSKKKRFLFLLFESVCSSFLLLPFSILM